MADHSIRDHFKQQAKGCEDLGSPFTATLCRILAADLDTSSDTGRRVLAWAGNPRDDALSLRLCAGLHRLVLAALDPGLASVYPPRPWQNDELRDQVHGAIRRHDRQLAEALDSPPQTNEVSRSAMLFPGLLQIARKTGLPIALNEIGASAGLNLLLDRYDFDYGGTAQHRTDSAVRLNPHVRGANVPLAGVVRVVSQHGCDLMPVDITQPQERLRLRSYVWADQTLRMQRLDAALEQAGRTDLSVEKLDAEDFLRRRLADRVEGAVFVLFHSIMWQYMPPAKRDAIETLMIKAGTKTSADSPLAWLAMEPKSGEDFATLTLTIWPGGKARQLARCDFHGRWIEWLDGP